MGLKIVPFIFSSGKNTKAKLVREYSDLSAEGVPSSPSLTDSLNLLSVLNQLQAEMEEIKEVLDEKKINISSGAENDEECNKGLRAKRWTRQLNNFDPSTDENAHRLHKVSIKVPNFVV